MRLAQSRSRKQLNLHRQTELPCKATTASSSSSPFVDLAACAEQAVCKQTIFRDRRRRRVVPLRLAVNRRVLS